MFHQCGGGASPDRANEKGQRVGAALAHCEDLVVAPKKPG